MSNNLNFITFGCKLNAFETQVMKEKAEGYFLTNHSFINSCAVTNEAVKQSRRAIRKEKRDNPTNKIVVTGCAAELYPSEFIDMPEVDIVIGNDDKTKSSTFMNLAQIDDSDNEVIELTHEDPPFINNFDNRTRAFVQIQNGCDHRCTFCIIPYGRGNSRSVPVADVVAHCRDSLADGHKEIVLTGVDITSYGPDIGLGEPGQSGLGLLVRAILDGVPELPRLRLSSIDAVEIDQALLDMVIHEPRLMPHLHLSLQAGDDMILKRMKRRHSRAEALAFCEKLKTARPDIAFGADLIAGFPTETDAMFENSRRLIGDCDLSFVHVFPFSPRPNTPAARMPQLDGGLIKQRAANLRETAQSQFRNWLARQHGQTARVLVEKPGEGRAENFARIRLDAKHESGALVDVKINGNDGLMLIGETL